jgi:hypothetical protein
MKVTVNNKPVNLNKRDFVAQGGEGSVYARGKVAYKVYEDAKRMIPVGKIQELSALTESNIIKPEDVILDAKGDPIGYTMRYVTDTYALCQLFTRAFKDRNGITPEICLDLIQKMQETIKHIHSKGILVVDVNEMNFLASNDFTEAYFIDVDSYQTPKFPATAISFAIISFQLFIGIHPYKGKHPLLKGLDARMTDNVSVLNPDVRMPKSCLPFSVIPQAYLDWYKAVLERGMRTQPPVDAIAAIEVMVEMEPVFGGAQIVVEELEEYEGNIIRYLKRFGTEVVLTDKAIYVNGYANMIDEPPEDTIDVTDAAEIMKDSDDEDERELGELLQKMSDSAEDLPELTPYIMGFTNKNNPVLAYVGKNIEGYGKIVLNNYRQILKPEYIDFVTEALQATDYGGRIYVRNGPNVVEVMLKEGNVTLASPAIVANIAEKSSTMFEGCLFQNLLGSYFVSIFPESGKHYQIKMDELDGYRLVEAKYDGGVLMVVGIKDGRYDRFVFRLSSMYTKYDVRRIEDIDHTGLNFVVLDSGICVCINEEDQVEVFLSKRESELLRIIEDSGIDGSMKLFKDGIRVLASKGNKLYSLKMK